MTAVTIPTLQELTDMKKKERHIYLHSIKDQLSCSYSEIARECDVSMTLVSGVFSGISVNQKVLQFILNILNNISSEKNEDIK